MDSIYILIIRHLVSTQHYQYHIKTRGSSKFFPTSNFLNQSPSSRLRHLHIHIRLLNSIQNDATATLPRFKTNEIKVIRQKVAIHAHTSARVEEDVLAMAVVLLAAVLLILHEYYKNNFSTLDGGCPKDGIKSREAGIKWWYITKKEDSKMKDDNEKELWQVRYFRIWAYPLVVR